MGGDMRNLRFYVQHNNGGDWSICEMNMILHGFADADLQNEDTLAHPLNREGGELMDLIA
jgi:type I restriction-modification system DNA methylase subunit